jgi:HK97 family phage prohead protease
MTENLPVRPAMRTFNLEDLHVREEGGDGRIVEAYAAVFDTKSEIVDQDGHYLESLGRGAFTRTLNKGPFRNPVMFNHSRTIDGAPNPMATMPIGVPLEVKKDEHGLWTATRYLDNPLADQVLDAIKQGAIRAQSFSGKFRTSRRSYPDGRGRSALPLIERTEIELREYGPAVFAAYEGAAILGTRQLTTFMRSLLAMDQDERVEWLQQFEGLGSQNDTPSTISDSPDAGHVDSTEDTSNALSDRSRQMRQRIDSFRARYGLTEKTNAQSSGSDPDSSERD